MATIKRKVIETSKLLDDQHDNAIDKINLMPIGEGTGDRTTVDPLDHMMFSEEIKEHVK